jgi:hypothetical protein
MKNIYTSIYAQAVYKKFLRANQGGTDFFKARDEAVYSLYSFGFSKAEIKDFLDIPPNEKLDTYIKYT